MGADIYAHFTKPADFIYDKNLELDLDYDHIADDNYDRFVEIGLTDKYIIKGLDKDVIKDFPCISHRNMIKYECCDNEMVLCYGMY